jgi:hypothetical protein
MEQWLGYKGLEITIERIIAFFGQDRECHLVLEAKKRAMATLYFPSVFDFRYGREETFVARCAKQSTEIIRNNRIFTVENSEYFNNFCYSTMFGLLGNTAKVKHYVLLDKVDTGIELLADHEPVLRWLTDDDLRLTIDRNANGFFEVHAEIS